MKRFLKGFLKVMLCLTSISALCISLFVMTNYNSDKVDVSKNGTSILELEKRVEELEEEIEDVRASFEKHIHTQYELKKYHNGKDPGLQIEVGTSWVEKGNIMFFDPSGNGLAR